MLERLIVRNFKRFEEVELELGQTVLFVGPNNSGKTSALQALSLWELGVRRWHEKRQGSGARKRTGVAINRRDLINLPIPEAHYLWRDLHLRRVETTSSGRRTQNIRIEIEVFGVTDGRRWHCPLEFDFGNSESIYCRPLRGTGAAADMGIPEEALSTNLAYLPPMSGLVANETRLDPGAVQVRLGEGRTAEVLRNLCHQIYERDSQNGGLEWHELVETLRGLFGVTLAPPEYIPERGEVVVSYREASGLNLDLSAAGRGFQQTLLLLAYGILHRGAVLLLDEPDAHLEILRQRQLYQILTDLLQRRNGQLLIATHSEILLNEAADRDVVLAFVGAPHRIDDRGTQVAKSLKLLGFESYHQAEQTGWVLYLEGSTDLATLRAFARIVDHPAKDALERPFVQYIGNHRSKAEEHFFGLKEAKNDLVGMVLLDRQDQPAPDRGDDLLVAMWQRREIESYLAFPEVLIAYAHEQAESSAAGPLFVDSEKKRLGDLMEECISDQVPPAALRDMEHRFWNDTKASDEFLDLVFRDYFSRQDLPNLMRKTDYHRLAHLVPSRLLDAEVTEKLDSIVGTAGRAKPRR